MTTDFRMWAPSPKRFTLPRWSPFTQRGGGRALWLARQNRNERSEQLGSIPAGTRFSTTERTSQSDVRSFEGDEAHLRAWVFSIARRRVADHRRAASRRRTDPVESHRLDLVDPRDPESVVVDGLSGEEAADFVVRTLPADQADVVLLRVLGGLDVAEVAHILGKKPGTIRVLQHRGLRTLAQRLTGKSVTR